jgi:uncharacterized protein YjbI with pentapeptide repeats
MTMNITRWDTGAIIYSGEAATVCELLTNAVNDDVNCYRARLVGARLDGASLDRASLVGANLDRAKIGEFELTGKYLQLGGVCEWGPMFAYVAKDHGLRVKVGCRHFSIEEARKHWAERVDRIKTRVALSMAELWFAGVCK